MSENIETEDVVMDFYIIVAIVELVLKQCRQRVVTMAGHDVLEAYWKSARPDDVIHEATIDQWSETIRIFHLKSLRLSHQWYSLLI